MSDFIHLYTKSKNSLLESCISIKELVLLANYFGMEYLALTDTSTLKGVPEFLEICRENGVKPLIGCEFSVMHYYHKDYSIEEMNPEGADQIVLFARNTVGYRCIFR